MDKIEGASKGAPFVCRDIIFASNLYIDLKGELCLKNFRSLQKGLWRGVSIYSQQRARSGDF